MSDADLAKLIDRYCAAWCEDDAGKRSDILQQVFAERATYTDPELAQVGRTSSSARGRRSRP